MTRGSAEPGRPITGRTAPARPATGATMGPVAEFLIITGLSGAGRSQAAATFEDVGWFVIDNMPTPLITKVAELVGAPGSETERVALVVGRSGGQLEDLVDAIAQLRSTGARVKVLFLEASDEALVRRYEGTRRRHPLSAGAGGPEPAGEVTPAGVAESIALERELLQPVRETADIVLDTTDLNVHQLRDRLLDLFTHSRDTMQIQVVSFGFKHGVPIDVDNVFDCRFLANPHWVDELRPLTGLDPEVRRYVLDSEGTRPYLDKLEELLSLVLPAYVKEGKSYLKIGIGCTGGRHRSVVLAEELGRRIEARGFAPLVTHRDIDR
jgi:RNase adapter protein RapZ